MPNTTGTYDVTIPIGGGASQSRNARRPGVVVANSWVWLYRYGLATLRDMQGNDIAYDVHVRRVMMRTGLAERDDAAHMIAVAREFHPERPGELDFPMWHVGRTWCDARLPRCGACALSGVCPQFVSRGDAVKSV